MKILVTGADGYLGSKIVFKLNTEWNHVIPTTRKDCDLLDLEQVRELMKIQPDRIIHCAAFVPKNLEEYDDDRNKLSLDMFINILELLN
jgi:dTDP-4-dehydrorhamnose reductase